MWTLVFLLFATENERLLVLWKLEEDNTIKQFKTINWYNMNLYICIDQFICSF